MTSTTTAFTHLQIPLKDILEATNNFDEKKVIGDGGFGKVYRGRLWWSGKWVKIAARRLDAKNKNGIEFLTEISVLSSLNHGNIVSIIGYCDENGEKVIVNKHEAKGSLVMYLSNPNLKWIHRLRIGVGVARALSYIHKEDGRSYSVIHRNINSSTILLDDKFEPKLSGFEYSIIHSVQRMDHVLLSEAIGTTGYMDPEIEKTGGVTHKSDIYSFGVVLLEILCGRKAFIPNEDEDDRFLVSLAKEETNKLWRLIPRSLFHQIGRRSGQTFTKAAIACLTDERARRPDMNYIVRQLEKALELQLPFQSLIRDNLEHLESQLSHLKIRLADIYLALDSFSKAFFYVRTEFYDLYRVELELSDKENSASVEEKNKTFFKRLLFNCLGKKNKSKNKSTVILKRLVRREDKYGEEVFFTDIEMLTTCKHRNIVTLLGFCDEGLEKILVVEDASNGYLHSYLLNHVDKSILTWEKRLKICLDAAYGLKYLHYEMEDQKSVINRHFSTISIALDENFGAKIVDFGFAVFLPLNQDSLIINTIRGNELYIDPLYQVTGVLKRESDVYAFGIVLFEILCGRMACDQMYMEENEAGLVYVARQRFHKGTLMEMIDPIIITKGPNKRSLDTFVNIAFRCSEEAQNQRPTMKVVVEELEKALSFQEQEYSDQVVDGFEESLGPELTHESLRWNHMKKNLPEHLNIRLSDLRLATDKFSMTYLIGDDGCCYLYKVEIEHFGQENFVSVEEKNKSKLPEKHSTVTIKRLVRREDKEREKFFFNEIEMLTTCKHRNIVPLLGVCCEDLEMILVFGNAHYTLADYFYNGEDKPVLTWTKRLRICLDVAYGLKYLHYEKEDQKMILHRRIMSTKIVLDENFGAKINGFGESIFIDLPGDHAPYAKFYTNFRYYTDPAYWKNHKLIRELDVYSFGVVLFEVLFGRVAFDRVLLQESSKGLAYVARRRFRAGTLNEMIDPIIKEENGAINFTLDRGPNKDSLNAFVEIAYRCLEKSQDKRPTMKVVVEELEKALSFQENNKDILRISLEDVQVATENFRDKHCVGGGGFGKAYKGKLPKRDDTIVAKRLDKSGGQGEQQFRNELQILFEYKHQNIISLVGYCDEGDAKIIVYEYASRGSLDGYLNDTRLTWVKRLKICIDVATALDFLHRGGGRQATLIHRDMKTANILLNDDWSAKLADFGLSLISAINQETDYVIDHACGTRGYVDPLYLKSRFLTKESDIYSFGVVLFEILCGRSTFVIHKRESVYLPNFIKDRFEKGKHDTVVFEEIKAQIMPEALSAFQTIAYQCLNENREERPKAKEVVEQLKRALELQMSGSDGASTSTSCQLQD